MGVPGYNTAVLRSGRLENTPMYSHVYSSPFLLLQDPEPQEKDALSALCAVPR